MNCKKCNDKLVNEFEKKLSICEECFAEEYAIEAILDNRTYQDELPN